MSESVTLIFFETATIEQFHPPVPPTFSCAEMSGTAHEIFSRLAE
jgi:hypothetical protein